MPYQGLVEYIHAARAQGATDEELTLHLTAAGWYTVDVQDALQLHAKLTVGPVPTMATQHPPSGLERLAPRSYSPRLVAIAAFSFAIGFVGYLVLAG